MGAEYAIRSGDDLYLGFPTGDLTIRDAIIQQTKVVPGVGAIVVDHDGTLVESRPVVATIYARQAVELYEQAEGVVLDPDSAAYQQVASLGVNAWQATDGQGVTVAVSQMLEAIDAYRAAAASSASEPAPTTQTRTLAQIFSEGVPVEQRAAALADALNAVVKTGRTEAIARTFLELMEELRGSFERLPVAIDALALVLRQHPAGPWSWWELVQRSQTLRDSPQRQGVQLLITAAELRRRGGLPFGGVGRDQLNAPDQSGFGAADCPNTDEFFDHMVSFPFHHGLTDEQIEIMIEAAQETMKTLRG